MKIRKNKDVLITLISGIILLIISLLMIFMFKEKTALEIYNTGKIFKGQKSDEIVVVKSNTFYPMPEFIDDDNDFFAFAFEYQE